MLGPDEASGGRVHWLPLSEIAKQVGLANDKYRRTAAETVPVILQARAEGLEDRAIAQRLSSVGVHGREAGEIIEHVNEASRILALVREAQGAASTVDDLRYHLEASGLAGDKADIAVELINTAFFRCSFFSRGGRPFQFPGCYEHAFIFHVAFWHAQEQILGKGAPYPRQASGPLARIRSLFRFV